MLMCFLSTFNATAHCQLYEDPTVHPNQTSKGHLDGSSDSDSRTVLLSIAYLFALGSAIFALIPFAVRGDFLSFLEQMLQSNNRLNAG